ncbi:hypothetical protein BC826DRAFT_974284 [Russula brevipes]|nr:hypothetical protein BC826DRAFT_974284 [Russula brevipes]
MRYLPRWTSHLAHDLAASDPSLAEAELQRETEIRERPDAENADLRAALADARSTLGSLQIEFDGILESRRTAYDDISNLRSDLAEARETIGRLETELDARGSTPRRHKRARRLDSPPHSPLRPASAMDIDRPTESSLPRASLLSRVAGPLPTRMGDPIQPSMFPPSPFLRSVGFHALLPVIVQQPGVQLWAADDSAPLTTDGDMTSPLTNSTYSRLAVGLGPNHPGPPPSRIPRRAHRRRKAIIALVPLTPKRFAVRGQIREPFLRAAAALLCEPEGYTRMIAQLNSTIAPTRSDTRYDETTFGKLATITPQTFARYAATIGVTAEEAETWRPWAMAYIAMELEKRPHSKYAANLTHARDAAHAIIDNDPKWVITDVHPKSMGNYNPQPQRHGRAPRDTEPEDHTEAGPSRAGNTQNSYFDTVEEADIEIADDGLCDVVEDSEAMGPTIY